MLGGLVRSKGSKSQDVSFKTIPQIKATAWVIMSVMLKCTEWNAVMVAV